MTIEDLQAIFEKHNDEYIKFERVTPKLSQYADLHAFLLLEKLLPLTDAACVGRDMVSAAEHDESYLNVDLGELAEVIAEDQVVELARCGVRYKSEYDCLAMFV